MFGFALIAKERQSSALWLNLRRWRSTSGLNFRSCPRYGIVVAAVVTVASEVLILAGSYALMRRHFDFFPAPRTLLPALVARGRDGRRCCGCCATAPSSLLVPLGAAVYAGLLCALSPGGRELVTGCAG